MGNLFTTFVNCRLCINGEIVEGERLVVSQDTGEFLKSTGYIGGDIVDLDDGIIAPGFLDLYSCTPPANVAIEHWLAAKSAQYVQQGVTGFWLTTNEASQQSNAPLSQAFANLSLAGPAQLGTHIAFDSTTDAAKLVTAPALASKEGSLTHLKLATLPVSSLDQISALSDRGIKIAMSSSSSHNHNNTTSITTPKPSNYAQAESALYAGATAIAPPAPSSSVTDSASGAPLMTAMDPGSIGLLALHDRISPYVFIPCDGETMHPKTATLLFRATLASKRAILCCNPLEAGTGAGDVEAPKSDAGGVGVGAGSGGIDQAVRNMYYWSNCNLAQVVQAVTENVARFMGIDGERGRLAEGCRADFVVLDDGGNVRQTWIAGHRVWPLETSSREGSPDF